MWYLCRLDVASPTPKTVLVLDVGRVSENESSFDKILSSEELIEIKKCDDALEKVRGVYRYLTKKLKYNGCVQLPPCDFCFEGVPGRGNMEISNTLMVVLNKLGIECCKVFGKFDYFLDIKPHIWNIVKINGEWKHFDLTNDLEKDEGNWMWFNVSNDDMLQKTVVGLNTKRFFIIKNEIVREFLRSVKNNFCYVESYA